MNKDLLTLLGVGAAAYFAYWLLSQAKKQTQAFTAPLSNAIASIWNRLTLSAPLKVLGNVILPDGTDVGPLSSFQVGTDTSGNVYIQALGAVYQVGQSDSNGNWPVQLVLAPDFGVTGATW